MLIVIEALNKSTPAFRYSSELEEPECAAHWSRKSFVVILQAFGKKLDIGRPAAGELKQVRTNVTKPITWGRKTRNQSAALRIRVGVTNAARLKGAKQWRSDQMEFDA
jgi:hypothetical protein